MMISIKILDMPSFEDSFTRYQAIVYSDGRRTLHRAWKTVAGQQGTTMAEGVSHRGIQGIQAAGVRFQREQRRAAPLRQGEVG